MYSSPSLILMSQANPRTKRLGDYTSPTLCPCCDGSGYQLELVYRGGQPGDEREVPCYGCQGLGQVIELVCGRCGEVELADPDARADDFRICSCCGHEAPQLLWLPMGSPERLKRRYSQG